MIKGSPCLSPGLDAQYRNTASPWIVTTSFFFLLMSERASYGWIDMTDFAVITLQYVHEELLKSKQETALTLQA
jgi:hypothetical protein